VQLDSLDMKYTSDKALASRVVAVAEGEKGKYAELSRLGFVVGRIHQTEAGTFDRVKALVKGSGPLDMRKGVLDTVVTFNDSDPAVFDFVRELTKDADKDLSRAAIYGLKYASKRAADACKAFADGLALPNVATAAAVLIAEEGHNGGVTCDAQIDALLSDAQKRAKAGTIDDTAWPTALGYVAKNSKATDAQKKQALAVAKMIVENAKNNGYARASALGMVGDADAKAAKGYANKFLKDKDSSVASRAKSIHEKK
jgi:hypothetical protein